MSETSNNFFKVFDMKVKSNMNMKKNLIYYVIVTYILSIPFYMYMDNLTVIYMLMWLPAIIALVIGFLTFKKDILTLMGFFRFGKLSSYVLALFLPALACLVVYGIAWITGLATVDMTRLFNLGSAQSLAGIFVQLFTISLASSVFFALGEEIGWRGFMTPLAFRVFSKHIYLKTVLLVTIIWSFWHFPAIFSGDYSSGLSIWITLPAFTLNVAGACCLLTALRFRDDTFWSAALFHGSHNLIIQSLFDVITIDTSGYAKYITTEFGFGLAIVYIPVGIYLAHKSGAFTR